MGEHKDTASTEDAEKRTRYHRTHPRYRMWASY